HYYCTCQGWRIQSRAPVDARTCKHLKELLGESYERERLKWKNPDGVTVSTTKPPKKLKLNQPAPKVLLAHSYSLDIDPTGYWMSEKLDGVRAVWDPKIQTFLSRTGNPFFAPKTFTTGYPEDMTLDGELFSGRGQFNSTVSIVRTMNSPNWNKIRYKVFDVIDFSDPFESRQSTLQNLKSKNNDCTTIDIVEQTIVRSRDHVIEELKNVEQLGGEGLMLRSPNSLYEGKRSKSLLKVKSFYDAEAIVEGYEDGKGKHKGTVGALKCKMECGKVFKIGTGLSDAERRNPPKIGDIVTYKLQELTPDGKKFVI
ncbi:hypothetical protein HK096_011428, partial [Nowakowskiella sp. JEL0078]